MASSRVIDSYNSENESLVVTVIWGVVFCEFSAKISENKLAMSRRFWFCSLFTVLGSSKKYVRYLDIAGFDGKLSDHFSAIAMLY